MSFTPLTAKTPINTSVTKRSGFTPLTSASPITPVTPQAPEQGMVSKFVQGAVNVGKDILGVQDNQSISFIPSLLRSTIGSQGLAGVAQLPGKVIDQAIHGPDEYNSLTPGQALGTAANAALTAATSGTGSLASKAGLTGVKALGARAVENAGIGAGFQAASNLSNKKPLTEGLGTAALVGGALPLAGTTLSTASKQAMPEAERVINNLVGSLGKDFAYGKNPARGIIKEGIVANSFDDLSQKVQGKIAQVGSKIGALSNTLDQSGQISLDLTPALAPIDEAIQTAAKSNNDKLFHSLNNVKVALLHDLQVGVDEKGNPAIIQGEPKNLIAAGYNEAKQFLTDIAEHTRFTGNPSDDKALNMATKKAYGIVREAMNTGADKVSPEMGVQIRDLNSRYADLLSAKNAINHRDLILKKREYLNLATKFSLPLAVGGALAAGVFSGDYKKAGAVLLGELGTLAAAKGLGSTAAKTRIAQFLSHLAPEERQGILNSTPAIKNIYERLTGRTEPDAQAPKTKVLQTVQDYMKSPKLAGNVNLKTLAGGAVATAGAIGATASSKVSYTAPAEAPVQKPAPNIGKVLMQLESSGGTNKASADKGEVKWLTGLTEVAIKELKRLGIKDKVDVNNKADVLDASEKYFELMQKRHPDLSPGEVYVDHYWTQSTSSEQRKKKIEEFNRLLTKN